jgi:diaminopropionate ammonia-lyase
MAEGLGDWLAAPGIIFVVEPAKAPAVAAALAAGRPVRVAGDLETTAEMLSCGEASAPALAVLRRHRVEAVSVAEPVLDETPALLRAGGGPSTTSSGGAGLAGVIALRGAGSKLGPDARLLIIISETAVEG